MCLVYLASGTDDIEFSFEFLLVPSLTTFMVISPLSSCTLQDGDLKYTLYGVLVHAGWSTHSGHYYCFVRTSSGMWYSLDDNRVIETTSVMGVVFRG